MKFRPTQLILFVLVSVAIIFAYTTIEQRYFPKPKTLTARRKAEVHEAVVLLATAASFGGLGDVYRLAVDAQVRQAPLEFKALALAQVEAKKKEEQAKVEAVKPAMKPRVFEFIDLGNPNFNLQVRLTTRGGGVDRVIVTHFPHANEQGVRDQSRNSLHLIRGPGDRTADEDKENAKDPQAAHEDGLPSFLMYHYAQPNELRPEYELGEREWKLAARPGDVEAERQAASFTTDLNEIGLRITKTYTLAKGDYHVGLSVRIERLPGAAVQPFRYSLSSGHAIPIEGVWYTGTYRNVYLGWVENSGQTPRRHMDDSASVHTNAGGEAKKRDNYVFQYAAVAGQYFASALCIDDQQEHRDFIERARATAIGAHPPEKPMLGDITARFITEELTPTEAKSIEHKYLLYHGPVKVRLLAQLRGDEAVSPELVERYEKTLNLRTMTDYHSDSMPGRFANFIGWTDLTIATTNLMHIVLGFLLQYIPVPALAILAVTLLVRGTLHPLSRRQQINTLKFQEKMKKHAPELKRLEESYKGKDPQEFQQAKLKYMMANGLNPMSQLGGCLLMFAQMPIFMGLYYCLQENVFFRLSNFLWMPSLAAPDMLVRWGDKIPFISDPNSMGNPYYLGPFFNLLPVIAVAVMFIQQKLMAPPPTDEQAAMQQSMFKYMMIIMLVMFYKVAAGMCLYFIASSLWGLAERKLIPKPKLKPDAPEAPPGKPGKGGKGKGGPPPKPEPQGPLGRMSEAIGDAWKKLLDAAEKK